MDRPDGRKVDELRPVTILPGIAPNATGSVLISCGNTRVICAVSIQDGVPRWMKEQHVKGGWLTAEYSMLPYSTGGGRKPRDISRGRLDGRSSEIQRLIGRSLRAVVDLKKVGHRTVWVDCDVLEADGGTRTASITGASLACALAFNKLMDEGKIRENPMKKMVGAVSCGVYEGVPVLDLNYIEDRDASVDSNFVLTEDLQFVEIQSSGEEATFSDEQMTSMLELSRKGITELVAMQNAAIEASFKPADKQLLDGLADHFGN